MANPILPTDGTHELQRRYAKEIKKLFRLKNNLRQFAGRNYSGDPVAGSVMIPVRNTEVSVGDYDVVTGGALGTSTTSYLEILVDKNKFVNELIDGYEAQAVPDQLVAQRLDSAAYSMQRQMELDFIKEVRDNATISSAGATALTDETAYSTILGDVSALEATGVDIDTMTVAISHATYLKLMTDIQFTNTASAIGSERAMHGVINMIGGAEVVKSSNLGAIIGGAQDTDVVESLVFSSDWAQVGDEWMVMPLVKDLNDGIHIGASHLAGRYVQWNKLTDAGGAIVKAEATA